MNRYATPRCPLDQTHGHLMDWPSADASWYCPARRHEGHQAFYTSDLLPAPRTARGVSPSSPARGSRRTTPDR